MPVKVDLGDEKGVLSAGLEEIENGDWVIITGEFKSGKEKEPDTGETEEGRSEAGETDEVKKAPFFLAKLVQTEDISENEIFTGEVVQVDEEKMVVREIPANKTAQAYRVRYEIREAKSLLIFNEEVSEDVSPKNPIVIEVSNVKAGSTYTIRVFIRNMEGRILCDSEHVGGFDVEEVHSESKK